MMIKSGRRWAASSNACWPSLAVTTSYPCDWSRIFIASASCSSSSTTRTYFASAINRSSCTRQRRPDGAEEFARIERFVQHAHPSQLLQPRLQQALRHGCQHDNWDAGGRPIRFQTPAQLVAVHHGHQQVYHKGIWPAALNAAQRLLAVRCDFADESAGREPHRQRLGQLRLVIYQEQSRGHGYGRAGWRSCRSSRIFAIRSSSWNGLAT